MQGVSSTIRFAQVEMELPAEVGFSSDGVTLQLDFRKGFHGCLKMRAGEQQCCP